MPDLSHSLRGFDLQHLKHLSDKWGILLQAPDAGEAIPQLVEEMTDPELVREMVEALPEEPRQALRWLAEQEGRVPWDSFTRRFGEVREMGSGKRDRERPDLDPISPAEFLWYRAFLARGFFDTESGPKEFAFLPDDLYSIVRADLFPGGEAGSAGQKVLLARKATPQERVVERLANAALLHHTCTILAAYRMDINPEIHLPRVSPPELGFYCQLLQTSGLLDEDREVRPDQVRELFDLSWAESLLTLWRAWRDSSEHNDLQLTPGLQTEGTWDNQPRKVRSFLLQLISQLPRETWLSTSGFVARVKKHHPDFQRSAGEYDSWYIKDEGSGEYLRGFKYWDAVEGALLRYLISGPLHWLGVMDLASPEADNQAKWSAFRISDIGEKLLRNQEPPHPQPEPDAVQVRSKGLIRITKAVPRKVRYQVARFCEWRPLKKDAYVYVLTPSSLANAKRGSLEAAHLLTLLDKYADAVPPNVIKAIKRWDQRGVQAVLERETVLRLSSPAMLQALQKSKAQRFLREQLGPTAVVIQEGSEVKLIEALAEMGFLTDFLDQD